LEEAVVLDAPSEPELLVLAQQVTEDNETLERESLKLIKCETKREYRDRV
jgi:hypothetical protein